MKSKTAILAIAVVFIMAAPMMFVSDSDVDADVNSVSHGEFDIYLRSATATGIASSALLSNITTQWLQFDVEGYDACKAIMNLNTDVLSMNKPSYSINNTFNVELENEYGKYFDVDPNYGAITKMLMLSNNGTMSWHAWVYVSGEDDWTAIPNNGSGIGHYRPFSDYSEPNHRAANIALFYGTDAQAASAKSSLTLNPTQGIVDVAQMKAAGVADYQVTVTLKNSTSNPADYIVQDVIGYGSDVYAAIKDVCSSQNISFVGTNTPGNMYGYIKAFNGLYNTIDSPWIPYWAFFDNSGTSPVYTSYLAGYYSPLTGGYFQTDSVLFTYGNGSA